MMEALETVKIFLPSSLLNKEGCLLTGWRNTANNVCCVTGYIPLPDIDNFNPSFFTATIRDNDNIDLLGLWQNNILGCDPEVLSKGWDILRSCPSCIHLTNIDSDLPTCCLYGQWKNVQQSDAVVVLYDAKNLHMSELLETEIGSSNLAVLSDAWQKGIQVYETLSRICDIKTFVTLDRSSFGYCVDQLTCLVFRTCLMLSAVLSSVFDNRITKTCWNSYLPQPASVLHLARKSRELHLLIHNNGSGLSKLRLTNMLWRQALDMLLGMCIMYALLTGGYTEYIACTVMTWAETVASELHHLLQWMMGVPAGLKLNHELAHFLGQFFLYHIYLWTGYLRLLAPLWTDGVWYIAVSGCLGVTVQLCLIQDLLSMMTLHSYCFYVYAARLYSLQVSGLVSLWRLFRGKKWNPLFKRVDSSSYDVDQLFIGTLLFTILLFLLPTTGLFYVVFTGLRLVVLMLQGIFHRLVAALDTFPIYFIYLRFLNPNIVSADVRLHVFPALPSRPLYHAIQLLPVSFSKLYEFSSIPRATDSKTRPSYTWGFMMKRVISGKLVYPWIEPFHS